MGGGVSLITIVAIGAIVLLIIVVGVVLLTRGGRDGDA